MEIVNKSFIFESIPNKISSHSVSLCKVSNTEILAFWFSGTWEGEKDADIFFSRYNISEDKWSRPKILIHDPFRSLGNTIPIVFDETLRLYYCAMEGKDWTESSLWYIESYDKGFTWSKSNVFSLHEDNLLFGTKILSLEDGRYVFPLYNEKSWLSTPYITNNILANKWQKFGEIRTEKGNIQQDWVELSKRIFSLLRTRDGFVYKTIYDFESGQWTDPVSIGIPNPNSRIALEKMSNILICCCNPLGINKENLTTDPRKLSNFENEFWGKREKLSIYASYDQGNTWKEELVLEEEKGREYSYPWIQLIDESRLMIAYTYERQKIAYVIIKI